jgi:hypothetical protein
MSEQASDRPDTKSELVFLGNAATTSRDRRLATAVVLLLALAFTATARWATTPLLPLAGFVPAYNAAVATLDFLTAILLFAQYAQLREKSFLALAAGYLFSPVVIVAHALSFPDAFVPGNLIGGEQSTA